MNENRASLAYRGDGVINTKVFRPDEGVRVKTPDDCARSTPQGAQTEHGQEPRCRRTVALPSNRRAAVEPSR
jgi:hypothetical protein